MLGKIIRASFLPILTIILITSIAYVMVQQTIRDEANDAPIDLAQNISETVEREPTILENQQQSQTVDPTKSDSMFIQVYKDDGSLAFSTLQIGQDKPTLSKSDLEASKNQRKAFTTWAPTNDVRLATVISRYEGNQPGYVVTGKSLAQAERRINNLTRTAALGAVAASVITLIGAAVLSSLTGDSSKTRSVKSDPKSARESTHKTQEAKIASSSISENIKATKTTDDKKPAKKSSSSSKKKPAKK